jgi:hypothetical protein
MNLRRLVDWFSVDRFNRWLREQRERREADEVWQREVHERNEAFDENALTWLDLLHTPEDQAPDHLGPVKMPGQRLARHAAPRNLPRQRNDEDPR